MDKAGTLRLCDFAGWRFKSARLLSKETGGYREYGKRQGGIRFRLSLGWCMGCHGVRDCRRGERCGFVRRLAYDREKKRLFDEAMKRIPTLSKPTEETAVKAE